MIAYLDSSVLLRVAMAEPGRLASWKRLRRVFSSELCRVECYRVLDRLRLARELDDEQVAARREILDERLDALETVALDRRILRRASAPMPTTLGTLDAIHLASALALRSRLPTLVVATHDQAMATAARALGFRVASELTPSRKLRDARAKG